MEIPGFYYDNEKKKYFRIEPGSSGQNRVTRETVRQKTSLEAIDDYRRSDRSIHLPQTLHKQEISFQAKYNLQEEVIRSRLKSMKKTKTCDMEVLDFTGSEMANVSTDLLVGSPESNNLFAILCGDSGSVIYHLSVDDILNNEFKVDENKKFVNGFAKQNRVVDMSYDGKCDVLSTLVQHFQDVTRISTSFGLFSVSDRTDLSREIYEFGEPIFSATHFQGLNVLGAEKKAYVFMPSQTGNIKIVKFKDTVTSVKTNCDGKMFIAGTNRGELTCYDVKNVQSLSRRASMKLFDKSVVYLQVLSDSNRVIASCHDHYLALTDLRMFDKPVVQYCNHSNSCSKIAFSLDESVDVLCSVGDDNLVRFWSINSGKLLHMYRPNSELNNASHTPTTHVWYSDSWKLANKSRPLMFEMSGNKLNVITNDQTIDD